MNKEELYLKKWLELNEKMMKENFIWGTLEEKDEYEQYMSYDIYKMSRKQWNEVQEATKKISHIINKSYKIIYNDLALRSSLGLPAESWEAVDIPSNYFSYFTRFDLIINNGQIKVIEVNCDTPTGYLETSVANRIICEEHGYKSPNKLESNIHRAWTQIIRDYGIERDENVYFTSYGWHDEDRETVKFNMKHSGLDSRAIYIPIEDIVVADDGVYDDKGNKIKYLYRLYPLEYLIEDYDENGRHIGKMFLNHIAEGRVKVINPPSAFMMQSKAVMAIIWSFCKDVRTDLFTIEELIDINKYFLPTYFDTDIFEYYNIPYVSKPIFGREGGGVKIIDDNGKIVEKDEENWYSEWASINQQYVEMPDMTLNTWGGEYAGKLLFGSFLIGGEPSGLFLRVGEKITGNLSMFCGITVVD